MKRIAISLFIDIPDGFDATINKDVPVQISIDDMPTPNQRMYLENRGLWKDGMTKGEAGKLIGDWKKKEEEKQKIDNEAIHGFMVSPLQLGDERDIYTEPKVPLPWEEPVKRKRGRPKKQKV